VAFRVPSQVKFNVLGIYPKLNDNSLYKIIGRSKLQEIDKVTALESEYFFLKLNDQKFLYGSRRLYKKNCVVNNYLIN
jgi:hypothetical protein